MYQLMTVPEIRKWLGSLIKKVGMAGAPTVRGQDRLTLDALSKQTGIPTNSLKWLVYKDTAHISLERQRALSKIAAEYENGQVAYRGQRYGAALPMAVERPRPILRYAVSFGARGVGIKAVPRPKPVGPGMPSFKSLLGK